VEIIGQRSSDGKGDSVIRGHQGEGKEMIQKKAGSSPRQEYNSLREEPAPSLLRLYLLVIPLVAYSG
jgi:hypothetical protein